MPLRTKLRDLVLRERIDPLPRRLARVARVARGASILGDISLRRAPAALRLIIAHGLNVRSVVALHAIQVPDRLALIDGPRALTYRELDHRINCLANALGSRFGVTGGAPVVLMMDNRLEYVVAWVALLRLGARAVHASYRLTRDELAHQIGDSGARLIICSPLAYDAAHATSAAHPEWDLALVAADPAPAPAGFVSFDELLAEGSPVYPARPTAPSDNIVYTSGTTGRPKGAVRDLTRFGLFELSRVLDRIPMGSGGRHLIVSPLYHSAGQVFLLINLGLGATIHLCRHFDAEETLRALSEQHIGSVFLVPTMLHRVLDLPRELHARLPTPDLAAIVCGAAPFPPALRERAARRFGPPVLFDFYGATELGWVTLARGDEMLERPGTVGRPLPGQQVRIRDEKGEDLPAGEVGTIWVRNEQTMQGYLNESQADTDGRRDGWVTVDDLGAVDQQGYVYLRGRARDMVISGGVNIYPAEIEDVLSRHGGVREAAVVGVPDDEWGERLVAVVALSDLALDTAELERHAREHLASFKVPRQWEVVEELPRNPTGKVLKSTLREMLLA